MIRLLPGWARSKGACLEFDIAQRIGMRVELCEGAEKPVERVEQEAVAAWRGINDIGEVVTEWIEGAPPERMTNFCGNDATYAQIELAYTTPQPAAPAAQDVAGLEREAETERQIQRACGSLPEGWSIQLELENGAGYAVLFNQQGLTVDYGDDFDGVAAQIEAATDCALAAHQSGGVES